MSGRRLSPLARGILIGICLIAFFILLENFLGMASRVSKEVVIKKEQEQIQKEYEKTEKYEEEVFIEKSIEETMKLFEAQDYETLFNHLDDRYKLCMGIDSVEELKNFIVDFYGEPNNMSLLDFSRTDDCLICRVRIELEGEMIIKPLVVVPGENDDFTLMFDEIQLIENYPASSVATNSKIRYQLKYKMQTSSGFTKVFEMTNRTSKTITGSLADSYVLISDGREYSVTNIEELSSITLAPNETKTLLYKIDTSDGKYLDELETKFVFKETNGSETISSILRPSIYDFE